MRFPDRRFASVAGRVIGGVVSFAIPVVLARVLLPTAFGTYKQLFLIYMTLYGVAQLGAAESLYYFVPRKPAEAARSVANALATLTLVGTLCLTALYIARDRVAGWMGNSAVAAELPLLALFLTLTLISAAFEIVIVSRKEAGESGDRLRRLRHRAHRVVCHPGDRLPQPACGPDWRRRVRRSSCGGDAGLFLVGVRPIDAAGLRPVAPTVGLCAAVCGRRRHRRRPGQRASVGRRHPVRCGSLRDLCRRVSADSAGRSDLHVNRQRDDGEDGRVARRAATTPDWSCGTTRP